MAAAPLKLLFTLEPAPPTIFSVAIPLLPSRSCLILQISSGDRFSQKPLQKQASTTAAIKSKVVHSKTKMKVVTREVVEARWLRNRTCDSHAKLRTCHKHPRSGQFMCILGTPGSGEDGGLNSQLLREAKRETT
jgi:hypothetical protein